MRKVMIGTPCYGAMVGCLYANSLAGTIALGARLNIQVLPLFIPGNALVHSARNEIISRFLKSGEDDLVFIDADISWVPEDFFRLLNHEVEAVGGTYPYKKSELQFMMKTVDGQPPAEAGENGLLSVEGLGMGFFRLTRAAVQKLWDKSVPFKHANSDDEYRAVFECLYQDGNEVGEDIAMCQKLDQVWCDPLPVLSHSGIREHYGDPVNWLNLVRQHSANLKAQATTEINSTLDTAEAAI